MKIAHFIDSLAVGGAERVAVDCCNLLASAGHSVQLVIIREGGTLTSLLDEGVGLLELKFFSKVDLRGWLRLINSLRGFDIVHVHMRHTYGRVKIASFFCFFNVRILFHDHYGNIHYDKNAPFYFKYFFRPRWYIGVSKELTDWSISTLRVGTQQTFLLPNTVLRSLNDRPISDLGKFVVVSNFRRTKNIEFAIELCILLGQSLEVIGQVVDVDYFNYLVSKYSDCNVKFITDVHDVFPLLNQYSMALHTSKSETGPLVLIEYLAAGLPFLTFRTGEVVEQLQYKLPYSVMNDFVTSNWIDRILFLKNNQYSSNFLNQVYIDHFDPKNYYKKLIEIYKCVIDY